MVQKLSFLGPKIWDILPNEIKNSETLHKFKAKKKILDSSGLPLQTLQKICRTSRVYLRYNFSKTYISELISWRQLAFLYENAI